MNAVTNFARRTFDSVSSAVSSAASSTASKIANLGSTQIAIGNRFSFRARDIIDRRPNPISFSDVHAASIRLYPPRNLAPLENRGSNLQKANPQKEKKIFTQRFFAYYVAQKLSRSKYPIEEYVKFADKFSIKNQSPTDQAKDIWEAFKKTSLWDNLTLPEKVRAVAIYYLFGEIARNFLEDLADNFMNFFITHYSSKNGVSSLFETSLEKMNRFQAYFESTSEKYAQTNPRGSDFDYHLKADLAEGVLINAVADLKPGEKLTPNELFTRLNELFLEQFLPKLRIKEALLNKLRWSFDGNLEKAIWALPYALFIIINIPFLILAYTLEGFINSSVKDALKITPKSFNPFKLVVPSISDLIEEHVNKGWNQDLKGTILTYLYKQIQEIGGNDLPPSTDLNAVIRRKIEAFVPAFLKAIRLHDANGNREEMKKVLDPNSEKTIDKKFRLILESLSKEQALLPLFSFLTKDDFMENILHITAENLTRIYTKNERHQNVVTQEKLLEKIKEIMEPITKKGIKDTIRLESTVGSDQVQRFFTSYKRQFSPLLKKILGILKKPASPEILQSALDLLDRHRNAMQGEYQKFKELFGTSHSLAFRHVNRGLAAITKTQTKVFKSLIEAVKSQKSFDKETAQEKTLKELLEKIENPRVVENFLDEPHQLFDPDLKEFLTQLNKKRINLQLEVKKYRDAIQDLDIKQISIRMNLARISPLPLAFQESCDQLRGQVPSKYTESLEEPLQKLISYSEDGKKKLFEDGIIELRQTLQKIKESLSKDIDASKDSIKRITYQMKMECNNAIDLFNIEIFQDSISEHITTSVGFLREMETSTLALTSDRIVAVRPIQALSVAGGAFLGFLSAGFLSAINLPLSSTVTTIATTTTGIALGRTDPLGTATESLLVSQVTPKLEKIVGAGINLLFSDNNVYNLFKQTLAVVAVEEFSKKK